MTIHKYQYGRLLEDFNDGQTYAHPWEVTIDGGTIALFQASFLDSTPTYASSHFASALGFKGRPIHPLLLMNLGLSFSVHDVSEKAIAHLAYIDVQFPNPSYEGDTIFASSKVLGKKVSKTGDKGVVHVRTIVENQNGTPVCTFERKALVRAGGPLQNRPSSPFTYEQPKIEGLSRIPSNLQSLDQTPSRKGGFGGFFEDFKENDVFCHYNGKTVGDSEHMQLTLLMRNSHPIHFDENYCKEGNSFKGTRVVYGGLVFGFVASLASRDICGNVLWDLGFDEGAHPNGTVAGDTLYAASKVISKKDINEATGEVTIRLVGVKNTRPEKLIESGAALFTPELKKEKDQKLKEKVFEITRTILVLKKP